MKQINQIVRPVLLQNIVNVLLLFVPFVLFIPGCLNVSETTGYFFFKN